LNLGFNPAVVHGQAGAIQRSADALLDSVQARRSFDARGEFAFFLPVYVLSDLLGVHPEDRRQIIQWSVDFVDLFNVIPISVDTSRRLVRSASPAAPSGGPPLGRQPAG
jgi:cytochrome P450